MKTSLLLPWMMAAVLASGIAGAAEPSRLAQRLKAGKPQTIVTYGTSLTEGGTWVKTLELSLQRQYPGLVTVINSARSGMGSPWGVTNLEERVLVHRPDAVFLEFAINDARSESKVTVEEARKNLETMVSRILEKNPSAEIFLMIMNPPVNGPQVNHLEKRPNYQAYYQMYRDVASARGLRLIDNEPEWKAVLQRDRKIFDRWVPDGLHPSKEGDEHVTVPNALGVILGRK